MKLTLDLGVERCADQDCECGCADLTDAEILLLDAQADFKQFCFDVGEHAYEQLKEITK